MFNNEDNDPTLLHDLLVLMVHVKKYLKSPYSQWGDCTVNDTTLKLH